MPSRLETSHSLAEVRAFLFTHYPETRAIVRAAQRLTADLPIIWRDGQCRFERWDQRAEELAEAREAGVDWPLILDACESCNACPMCLNAPEGCERRWRPLSTDERALLAAAGDRRLAEGPGGLLELLRQGRGGLAARHLLGLGAALGFNATNATELANAVRCVATRGWWPAGAATGSAR